MDVTFFETASDLHHWLDENHAEAGELLLGFYKKSSGREGVTYAEALDEALCYGWIDGVRKSLGDESYTIRFTPRKPGSIWSAVNIKRAEELVEAGRMQPSGLDAFARSEPEKANMYSYERDNAQLGEAYEEQFRANPAAWDFFQAQPPSYRKAATWWVVSAKKEETRLRRLASLVELSAHGQRIPQLLSPKKR